MVEETDSKDVDKESVHQAGNSRATFCPCRALHQPLCGCLHAAGGSNTPQTNTASPVLGQQAHLPGHTKAIAEMRGLKLTSIESVMPSSHLILCRPLLFLPPIPPSIRVFSNDLI